MRTPPAPGNFMAADLSSIMDERWHINKLYVQNEATVLSLNSLPQMEQITFWKYCNQFPFPLWLYGYIQTLGLGMAVKINDLHNYILLCCWVKDFILNFISFDNCVGLQPYSKLQEFW